MDVSTRFNKLLSNIMLTPVQLTDGQTKHAGVRSCLNSHYYGISSDCYSNSFLIGSWGKSTQIRPPRDIDVLFILPLSVYQRFKLVRGNKQSQLLQEVRSVLLSTYPDTRMRADGQVVLVPFSSYNVEVVPGFPRPNGLCLICNTNRGGKYEITDPRAEILKLDFINSLTNGNARNLIRIIKCWQSYCTVPLKSFCIELLVITFLQIYLHKNKGTDYYNLMVRKFFNFLIGKSNTDVVTPGTKKHISLGNDWKSKAVSAFKHAQSAINWESSNYSVSAGQEWQNIFGTDIPKG